MSYPGKFEEYLRTHNYPSISYKSEQEICSVFSKTNRQFLSIWLLHKVNPHYECLYTEKDNVDSKITKALANYGLCSLKDATKFLNAELETSKQIEIFNRTFTLLDSIYASEPSENENIAQIKSLVSNLANFDTTVPKDVNLFPKAGPQYKLSDAGRAKLLDGYENEIKEYEAEIAELKAQRDELLKKDGEVDCSFDDESIDRLIVDLKTSSQQFQDTFRLIPQVRVDENMIKIEEQINRTHREMSKLLEFTDSKQKIHQNLKKRDLDDINLPNCEHEISDSALNSIFVLSKNILEE